MSCSSKINVSRKVTCTLLACLCPLLTEYPSLRLSPSFCLTELLSYAIPSKSTQIFAIRKIKTQQKSLAKRCQQRQSYKFNICHTYQAFTQDTEQKKVSQGRGKWHGMEINKETSTSSQNVALAVRICTRAGEAKADTKQSLTGYSCRQFKQLKDRPRQRSRWRRCRTCWGADSSPSKCNLNARNIRTPVHVHTLTLFYLYAQVFKNIYIYMCVRHVWVSQSL